MVTYDDLFSLRTYLGNLWSYAQISIVPNSFYTEDTTAEELLSRLREVPYFSENTESNIVSYKGHEGFIVCDNSNWSQVVDEKNTSHNTAQCEVIFLVGTDDSHFLSLMFLTDKRNKADIYSLMTQYLDKYITVTEEGSTNFGTGTQKLLYTDVERQTPEFRDALKNLVKYGILTPKTIFDGEHPLTWDEYIRIHVWAIYHKRLTDHIIPDDTTSPTFDAILKKLPIDRRAYVDAGQRATFELMLTLRLAGVELPTYSEASLDQFRLQKDTKYHAEWQKIADFEYKYFLGQKMSPNGSSYYNSGYYTSEFYITYNPITGLSYDPAISTDPIKFGAYEPTQKAKKALEAELACTRNSNQFFSASCYKKRQEYTWSFLSYNVLTK